MMNKDKVYHLVAGLLVSTSALVVGLYLGMVLVISAAISKEVWDYYNSGTVDGNDIVATIVGGLVGLQLIT